MRKQYIALLLTVLVAVSAFAATRYYGNAGFVHSLAINDPNLKLLQVRGLNNRATDTYIQLFETNAVPANGAVPIVSKLVFANTAYTIDFPEEGLNLANCAIAASTTAGTLTLTTGASDTDKVTILAISKN